MSGSKEKMQKQLSASLKRKLNIGELQLKVEGDSSDAEPAPKRAKELQSESTGPHTEEAETEAPGEGGVAEPDIMEVEHPETPATEDTKVVIEEEIKPTTEETKVVVEGELPGKPITTDMVDPRVQRIGLYVSGYPADTKKDDLKQKIEAVTGPCEDFKFFEDYVIAYYPCLKEAM
eukprot:196744_1